MLAKRAPAARRRDDLFTRVGEVLEAQGLGPEPDNYVFAYRLLCRDDDLARSALARLRVDGIRLSRAEIEAIGGNINAPYADRTGRRDPSRIEPAPGHGDHARPDEKRDETAARIAEQTRVQVEAVAGVVRTMHDQTRDFSRDLAESAEALEGHGEGSGDGIVRLTQAMLARVTAAETRLEQVAAETEALRAELAEAQVDARRDPLTGLPNRRAFDEAFARPAPGGRCLALIDIDRFKSINDGFGHAVGDRVLSAVARILADSCEGHLVTRQGGEEFAVLLAGCDLAAATRMIDGAREVIGDRRFRARDTDQAIGRVSVSAGVVAVTQGESADAALARVDTLLYRAKDSGRDRVIAG